MFGIRAVHEIQPQHIVLASYCGPEKCLVAFMIHAPRRSFRGHLRAVITYRCSRRHMRDIRGVGSHERDHIMLVVVIYIRFSTCHFAAHRHTRQCHMCLAMHIHIRTRHTCLFIGPLACVHFFPLIHGPKCIVLGVVTRIRMLVCRFVINRPKLCFAPSSKPPMVFVLQPRQNHSAHPVLFHQRINRSTPAHQHHAHRRARRILNRESIDVYRILCSRDTNSHTIHAVLLTAKHFHICTHALPIHGLLCQLRIVANQHDCTRPFRGIGSHSQRHALHREPAQIPKHQRSSIARTQLTFIKCVSITDLDVIRHRPAFG